MKLRIHGNALRLRLNQAEVAQFSKTGHVEEAVEFGPGVSLSYLLEACSKVEAPRAVFQNGELRIQMPLSAVQEWITTDRVGVSGEQSLGSGKHLSIRIEKDFKCIHSDQDDPSAYPNPLEDATSKS